MLKIELSLAGTWCIEESKIILTSSANINEELKVRRVEIFIEENKNALYAVVL
jgi:hypothetical protein